MKILLDTNFIITCIKENIDFDNLANELFNRRIKWIIPREVIEELKELSSRNHIKTKQAAKIALKLLENLKYKTVHVKDSNVDQGIAKYVNKHKIILATLDRKLKSKVKEKILTIRGKKSLEII